MKRNFRWNYVMIVSASLNGIISGCSPAKNDHPPATHLVQSAKPVRESSSCEETTRKLLCVTDYISDEEMTPDNFIEMTEKSQNRPCKNGHEDYKDYFMQVYRTTPEAVQKLICNVSIIYLEEGEKVPYGASVS